MVVPMRRANSKKISTIGFFRVIIGGSSRSLVAPARMSRRLITVPFLKCIATGRYHKWLEEISS
jgi:hypothetical protein